MNKFIVKQVTDIPQDEYRGEYIVDNTSDRQTVYESAEKNQSYAKDCPVVLLESTNDGTQVAYPIDRVGVDRSKTNIT